jgi:hypothetical protein
MMRNILIRLCTWMLRKLGVFKPCVVLWEAMSITEVLMADTGTCYCPLPVGPGHCVDLGYDFNGNLVAVKIWADVTTREKLDALRTVSKAA